MGKDEFGIGYRTTSALAKAGESSRAATTAWLIFTSISISMQCEEASRADHLDVSGGDGVPVVVAEICPHIIDDGGDLFVAQHGAERRHGPLSVDDQIDRIAAGFQLCVVCDRGIDPCAGGTLAVRHVAALADVG